MNITQIAFNIVECYITRHAFKELGGMAGGCRAQIKPNQPLDAVDSGQVSKEFGGEIAQAAGNRYGADG
jgi:hypothetical protein